MSGGNDDMIVMKKVIEMIENVGKKDGNSLLPQAVPEWVNVNNHTLATKMQQEDLRRMQEERATTARGHSRDGSLLAVGVNSLRVQTGFLQSGEVRYQLQ